MPEHYRPDQGILGLLVKAFSATCTSSRAAASRRLRFARAIPRAVLETSSPIGKRRRRISPGFVGGMSVNTPICFGGGAVETGAVRRSDDWAWRAALTRSTERSTSWANSLGGPTPRITRTMSAARTVLTLDTSDVIRLGLVGRAPTAAARSFRPTRERPGTTTHLATTRFVLARCLPQFARLDNERVGPL